MELLSATMQRNALVMANTIREGFAARPSIGGSRDTLSKKRARTSSQVARDDSPDSLSNPGVWMGSIDLRDAYYSVRVNPPFQRYFTCYWKGCYYEFLRMPNGYAQAPLLFISHLVSFGNMVMLQLSI